MLTRRQLLQGSTSLALASLALPIFASEKNSAERSLSLYNIHTGEVLNTTYWAQGQYLYEEVQELDLMLRDHRANAAIAMQLELYDKMYHLQQLFNSKEPLHIISGYRAPSTNTQLRHASHSVSENSLHIQGKAVDIRIPGVSHRHLHKAALAMRSGGVGYYPEDGFIHLDTGRVRHWQA